MNHILSKLQTTCPFPEVFTDTEPIPNSSFLEYRKRIGHLRADYDGYRWWNTWWPCHMDLITKARSQEIDSVYHALTTKGCFPGLHALTRFCEAHPEAEVRPEQRLGEYNFYYEGKLCNYWLRLITRRHDYNLYLHAFAKER